MKAVIFTRHDLTPAQLNELKSVFKYKDEDLVYMKELASKSINNEEDLIVVFNELLDEIKLHLANDGVVEVFGVIPVPLKAVLLSTLEEVKNSNDEYELVKVYEAWNVNRSPEGEKPTFEHYKFVLTAHIGIARN